MTTYGQDTWISIADPFCRRETVEVVAISSILLSSIVTTCLSNYLQQAALSEYKYSKSHLFIFLSTGISRQCLIISKRTKTIQWLFWRNSAIFKTTKTWQPIWLTCFWHLFSCFIKLWISPYAHQRFKNHQLKQNC